MLLEPQSAVNTTGPSPLDAKHQIGVSARVGGPLCLGLCDNTLTDGAKDDARLDGHLVSDPRRVRRHGNAADQDLAGPQAAGSGRGGRLSPAQAPNGSAGPV